MRTNRVISLVVAVGLIAFLAGYLMFGGKETNPRDIVGAGMDREREDPSAGGGLLSPHTPPGGNGENTPPENTSADGGLAELFGNSDDIKPPELPGL